jgi:hypothetical protein
MDNNTFFRIAAEQHLGYIKAAVQARAERIRNNTPTLRDLVQQLADVRGVYLVGSSKRGFYPFKLNVIMWREIEDNKPLSEQLRARFSTKSCRVDDTPGEWFNLNAADLEILKTEFQFISD